MKKPLNTRQMILVAVLLALILACGAVFAYMFMRTDAKSTQFVPAKVACEVTEEFDGTNKSKLVVKNTGSIDAYLRIRLVTYWVDGEGNIAAKSSEMPSFTLNTDWLSGSDNTYYYKSPVAPDSSTSDLLASDITLQEEDGYKQVIEVFAEAIQSKPAAAAVNSWGVTIDANGTITAVPTT